MNNAEASNVNGAVTRACMCMQSSTRVHTQAVVLKRTRHFGDITCSCRMRSASCWTLATKLAWSACCKWIRSVSVSTREVASRRASAACASACSRVALSSPRSCSNSAYLDHHVQSVKDCETLRPSSRATFQGSACAPTQTTAPHCVTKPEVEPRLCVEQLTLHRARGPCSASSRRACEPR
jgi:hypothetical protein